MARGVSQSPQDVVKSTAKTLSKFSPDLQAFVLLMVASELGVGKRAKAAAGKLARKAGGKMVERAKKVRATVVGEKPAKKAAGAGKKKAAKRSRPQPVDDSGGGYESEATE
jgi:hypothetical protein